MISVLIVEDDGIKLGQLRNTLMEAGVDSDRIDYRVSSSEAFQFLSERQVDLLLLDVNIPRRGGEDARRGEGFELLRQLQRGVTARAPRYIVGISAYKDVVEEFSEKFADQLWSLVHYSEISDQWKSQLSAKVEYITRVKQSENFSDGETFGFDLAIVCALDQLEFGALRTLPVEWQPLKLAHDETRYLVGTIEANDKVISVIAAAAPRMGMPAAGVLTAKMIFQFRPRLVAMVGICAGRYGKAELGDVLVADPVWDYGSGKVDSADDTPRFLPAPHQIELDVDIRSIVKEASEDGELLQRVRDSFDGAAPTGLPAVHVGPMASGAAVVANAEMFSSLVSQHRNLLGIEMEAYGVATACKGCAKPRPKFLVLKSVSDFADKDKNDDLQSYAAHTSARFLYEVAGRLF